MISASNQNNQIFHVNADDVVALHANSRPGLPVTDLRVTVYGMTEFELRDPDNYWLWFGQPSDEAPTVVEERIGPRSQGSLV